MSKIKNIMAAAIVSLAAVGSASAADMAPMPVKAKPIIDVPFFLVNDNRLTYSYQFTATDPGVAGLNNGKVAKQVYSFTHFDVWAYGTNFFNIDILKSDHNDPVFACPAGLLGRCAGATEIYGLVRSTFGFNEIFNTKAFSIGPLRNVSFEVGGDASGNTGGILAAKRDFVGGIQFAFDLPYKGFFNIAPLYYIENTHNQFTQCTAATVALAGLTCNIDGNRQFKSTWAVEMNYYMNLGFLPPAIDYFSISGRAGFYGKKGNSNGLPIGTPTAVEFNSEPIRLTFDASKALMGPKYSHFADVWVAYRYWQNKFGLDHSVDFACVGANSRTCTEQSASAGVTVKF